MDVLIIDDDNSIRSLLNDFLLARNHRVFGCSSAEEAMRQYATLFYPMIVVDVGLTGMSGIDFCRWVRKQPEGHRHFILVATGKAARRTWNRFSPQAWMISWRNR